MKRIEISEHAKIQMVERGVTKAEVEATIREGMASRAKYGRQSFLFNFAYGKKWQDEFYRTKQVRSIVAEETDKLVVVTVISYYF